MQLLQFSNNDESEDHDFQMEENVESFTEYENGTYHLGFIGEVLMNRYVLLEKIGKGNFSIVWLAKDFKNNQNVALKIVKQEQRYYDQGIDEIIIMQHLQQIENQNIIQFYNTFVYTIQNRNHLVLCFEILGISLFDIIQKFGYLDLVLVKLISKQILNGLYLLERQGIIHCDLKPQNILIQLSEEQMKEISKTNRYPLKRAQLEHIQRCQESINFKIIDFGSSCFQNKHFSHTIQTLNYRAPEVIVGCYYSNKADIWGFGCIIYELLTGQKLFQQYEDSFESQLQILNQIYIYFGGFNDIIKFAGMYSKEYFEKSGQLVQMYKCKNMNFAEHIKQFIQKKEFNWIQNLLNTILDPNHLQRPNIDDIISLNLFDDIKYLKILKDYQSDDRENIKKHIDKLSISEVKISSSKSLQQTYSKRNEQQL